MPEYHIKHITRYTYASPVIDSANQVMLFPISDLQQEVKKHDLLITQHPSVEVFTDYFGNQVGIFSLIKPHTELRIQSKIHVITSEVSLPEDETPADAQWENLSVIREQFPYMDFMLLENFDAHDEVMALTRDMITADTTPFAAAVKMSAFVFENFEYKKGVTSVETQVDEILKLKAGVCQDFAHVLLVMLRLSGIPARYVSGYICPNKNGMRGEGATHAWIEAFIPGFGWAGIDPTNNVWATNHHVKLAVGKDFNDCSPVKGTFKGPAKQLLSVFVSVGYEDGHVFEDVTNVPLQKFESDNKDVYFPEDPFEEQQQQQQ